MWFRRSLPLALVLTAVTCESPVTPVACSTPTMIETYSGGYEVERNICFDSGARPPYTTQSSDVEVAAAASSGNRLVVTGQNAGDAEITVSAAGQNGNAETVTYSVVTLDPWTLESFECTVEEHGANEGFPEGYYGVDYAIVGRAEVDLAELALSVYIDEYQFGQVVTLEDLAEGQEFGVYTGGAMSRAHHDVDVNDYECTVSAGWTY